ncbi:ATP-binding cassette domain-containing protein [Actinocorallia sp. A-T 12471]|uniref:ATP-binding cassette domain-containing protein n=1 Tax=Actinocorallia sp. A-T 12471 TaxID=3089813 RepID=UPI0029CC3D2D|nr:ATP-binding cassette domain-containing protein [Actinocorallia sp. A-T 12471]MDX6744255.1 ATP-binding cassette domain-containing protein [Actinocorallia sp. A-T 12471]
MTPAILAEGLRKSYPSGPALDGLDLHVPRGEVHGLLGPNGAGKTTAVKIMTTLLAPDSGVVRVAGHDPVREGGKVRARIGLVGQYAALDEDLTGEQNLVLFGSLSRLSRRAARRRAAELLERFGLADAAGRRAATYSGGMRRRLDLAAALLVAPEVLFVDEPTTGLDPAGRREVWDTVRALADGGTTVLLTTQYLEEADALADHVWLLARGTIAADGTPAALKARIGADRLDLRPRDPADLGRLAALAGPHASGPVETGDGRVSVPVADRALAVPAVAAAVHADGIVLADLAVSAPTLDEVFLRLVGPDAEARVAKEEAR